MKGRKEQKDLLPGTLEMLILQTLRRGALHGYAIAQHIQQTSKNVLQVEEGSLYPALQRLLREGWVVSDWGISARNRRVRTYKLTLTGRKQLDREIAGFERLLAGHRPGHEAGGIMNPVSRWLQKRRVEREMADEIAEHLAEKIDQLRDEGHSEHEAGALARRQFGNTTLQQEDSRAAWGWNTVEQFWQGMRFGWRVVTKTPAFTATAVIVLALGIGMNTAMFSAVKAVLLGALPYPEPERIVELGQTAKDGHVMNVSALDFRDWRAQSRTVEYMATYGNDAVTL